MRLRLRFAPLLSRVPILRRGVRSLAVRLAGPLVAGREAYRYRGATLWRPGAKDDKRTNRHAVTDQPHALPCRRAATGRSTCSRPPGAGRSLRALGSMGVLLLISACNVFVTTDRVPVDRHAPVDRHGDSRATATTVAAPSTTQGYLASGDIDYFRVEVRGVSSLAVHTTGSADTFGVLQDLSGRPLASDDNSGHGTNFLIEQRLNSGVYYIRVEGARSGTTGHYTLEVEQGDQHGDSRATATAVGAPSTTDGYLTSGDIDYFRVTLNDLSYLVVRTSGETDTVGVLQDRSGRPVARDDDSGSGLNFAIGHRLGPGVYYVRIKEGAVAGPYTLMIERTDIEEHGSSRATATYVPPDSDIGGYIRFGDVDYFKTVVDEAVVLTVFSTGATDTAARLEDASGRKLGADNDDGIGLNFSFSARLSPGTYYLRVKGYRASTAGEYRLWLVSSALQ